MTKISGIATTETAFSSVQYVEGERTDGTSVKVPTTLFPLAFSGALVHKSATQTAANYSAGTVITWDSEASGYDTDSYHSTVTNTSRITIATAGKYIFSFGLELQSLSASDFVRALIVKNGSITAIVGGARDIREVSAVISIYMNGTTAPLTCAATDYFEVWLDTESDTSIDVLASSWFSVQRVA